MRNWSFIFKISLPTICMVCFSSFSFSVPAKTTDTSRVLTGPWKFHIGDNKQWAAPGLNDYNWENIDLTPLPGAHDSDVGLSGYVPGWAAKIHPGYAGYAWYRLRVPASWVTDNNTFLLGPQMVDDVYQLYVNGRLIGGVGDFSHTIPSVYSVTPKKFSVQNLKADTGAKTLLIAFRVWVSPLTISGAADAGGIHIAPIIGAAESVNSIYHHQWMKTFWGYVADAVEPLLFIALAFFMFCRKGRCAENQAVYWFIAALIVTALVRASQVFYNWGQWENLEVYCLSKEVIFIPVSPGLWAVAWHKWFGLAHGRRVLWTAGILTALYILAQFCSLSWAYQAVHPHAAIFNHISGYLRLLFLLLFLLIMAAGIKKGGSKAVFAIIAIVLLCTGLFAAEVSVTGILGIWFPFGVGVSRTQYAYLLFDVCFLVLIIAGSKPKSFARFDGDRVVRG